MTEMRITFSRTGKSRDTELWANRRGTLSEIRESAYRLLEDLRREGCKHAAVFIDGRRIRQYAKNVTINQQKTQPPDVKEGNP